MEPTWRPCRLKLITNSGKKKIGKDVVKSKVVLKITRGHALTKDRSRKELLPLLDHNLKVSRVLRLLLPLQIKTKRS